MLPFCRQASHSGLAAAFAGVTAASVALSKATLPFVHPIIAYVDRRRRARGDAERHAERDQRVDPARGLRRLLNFRFPAASGSTLALAAAIVRTG